MTHILYFQYSVDYTYLKLSLYYQRLRLIFRYIWYVLLTTMLICITYYVKMLLPTLCSFRTSSSTMTSGLQPTKLPEFSCRPTAISAKMNSSLLLRAWNFENIVIHFLLLEVGVWGNLLFKSNESVKTRKLMHFSEVCLCWHVPPPKAVYIGIFY